MGAPSFIILSVFILPLLYGTASAQLRTDFYSGTCLNVESLVTSAVTTKFRQTFVTVPATLRLFFHDCMVRSCDASVLIQSPTNQAEKDHPDNLSLAGDGFDTVIKPKAAVDNVPNCRNKVRGLIKASNPRRTRSWIFHKVSCADILALATRDVVRLAGGPSYTVELGRGDGRVSSIASVQRRLPHPDFNLDQLNTMFGGQGLSQTDIVALSGAHTLGFSHCNRFSNRIYNFSPRTPIDPTVNSGYALQLRQMCPRNVDPRIAINMDPATPQKFDNAYFQNLQQGKGLFTSDQILFTDARSKATVNTFASSNAAFNQAFVQAMTKLGRVGVLTGNQGEIRSDCTRPN